MRAAILSLAHPCERLHRSTIVNVERVRECAPLGGEYRVALASGVRLVLSRGYRAAVLQRLMASASRGPSISEP